MRTAVLIFESLARTEIKIAPGENIIYTIVLHC